MYRRSSTPKAYGAVNVTAPLQSLTRLELGRPRTGGVARLVQRGEHLPEPHLVAQRDSILFLAIVEHFHQRPRSGADPRDRRAVEYERIDAIADAADHALGLFRRLLHLVARKTAQCGFNRGPVMLLFRSELQNVLDPRDVDATLNAAAVIGIGGDGEVRQEAESRKREYAGEDYTFHQKVPRQACVVGRLLS